MNEEELRDYLRKATFNLRLAHRKLQEFEAKSHEPIAVVAMSCRFPGGVGCAEDMWQLVADGTDTISAFPAKRGWSVPELYDPDPDQAGKTYVCEGGFIEDVDEFDASFFSISPREAIAMDPQQRLLLEISWEAFELAGIDPLSIQGTPAGIFVGSNGQDYLRNLVGGLETVSGYLGTGTSASVMSGRIAYALGLEGPAVTVDTACSSSLVAVHLACQSLRQGECGLALAGGVTVMATPGLFVEFSRQRGLAPNGRCKPFAAAADGTGFGEGAGLLLLERLSEAERSGHPVLAVIRGSAVSQDGASNGLTAPSGPAQQRVITQALTAAGLSPADIDAVEAHGTGTTLGDPIEAQALLAAYGPGRPSSRPLYVGSVKSNIGHTQAAAGIAGIIKMVQAIRHGTLPRSLHIDRPTPHVDWSDGTVALLAESLPWPGTGHPRRAGVSSFGISGTNAHLILEQAEVSEISQANGAQADDSVSEPPVPWPISGKGEEGLRAQALRLRAHVRSHPGLGIRDIGYSLATTRSSFADRAVVVAAEMADFERALEAVATGRPAPNVVRGVALSREGTPAFVFPGQGSQWEGMARDLLSSSQVFLERMRACADALAPHLDWSVVDVVQGAPGAPSPQRVDVVQPVLFAIMVALAEIWRFHGVRPGAVVGHSQGEIAAAYVAGALSLEDAARVVALRSQALARLVGQGAMLSVSLPLRQVTERISRRHSQLSIAAVNGPRSVVVSGDSQAIGELLAECEAQHIRARKIPVTYASHSAQVDTIREQLLRSLAQIAPRSGDIPFCSTVTGQLLDTATLDADYWFRNLRQNVRFDAAVRTLLGARPSAFVEISPHPVLTASMQEIIDESEQRNVTVAGSLRRDEGSLDRMFMSLAELHVNGVTVDWSAAFAGRETKRVGLPTYGFQRQRFWMAPPIPGQGKPAAEAGGGAADAGFWETVKRQDLGALASTLGVGEDAPLRTVLPAMSAWHSRGHDRSVAEHWQYRIRWVPIATPEAKAAPGTWLLVTSENIAQHELVTACARTLTDHGVRVLHLPMTGEDIDRGRAARRLRQALTGAASGPHASDGELPAITGVLSLLALDQTPCAPHHGLPTGLAGTLVLLQALLDTGVTARLWVATSGAVSVRPGDRAEGTAQAQAWGLGRVAALEHPQQWGGLVDLPETLDARASARLLGALTAAGDEDQLAVRGSGMFARRLVRVPPDGDKARARPGWKPRGTVLVTGGTGLLGPHIARWLARAGAEHVVLASRHGPDAPGAAELVAELRALGTDTTLAACDVSDRDALAALLQRLKSRDLTIRAVVHAAASIRLAPLADISLAELAEVTGGKVTGALHLDELFGSDSLDAFVLFSSIAGVWGSKDHGAYAAANAFLDALAMRRRAHGLAATSVAWGVWEAVNVWRNAGPDGEYLDQLGRQGLLFLAPGPAFAALEQALERGETSLAIADVSWDRFMPVFTSVRPSPLFDGVPEARAPVTASEGGRAADHAPSALRQRLDGLSDREQDGLVLDLVRAEAAAVLRHASPDTVQADRPFRDVGFDSLTAVDLRNRLSVVTGLRLPATLVFDYPTPEALANYLRTESLGIREADGSVMARDREPTAGEPVAVVAMGCRFPGGVCDPESLWQLVDDGRDAISPFPGNRGWDLEGLYDPDPDAPGKAYAREGGFVPDADRFDAAFFGISPREALAIDPQQRLLLEVAWETIERAGIDPSALKATPTGVFAGLAAQGYGIGSLALTRGLEGHLLTGTTASVASGRVAYVLGLEGPALTVDTACSSSLVAVHLAVQALRNGDCELALAGGVAIMATPAEFVEFSRQRALARDGRCKSFAAAADGMGIAEGAGLLLLERLSDARANGHPVLAVIAGSAVNQDGASNGLTAPNGPSQQRVIRAALAAAGLTAADIDAVEAHGTGTALGDPIEAQAIIATYGRNRPDGHPLYLGSVKSNIGHTQAAAGVAGVIKTIMAMRHGVLPRTLHADEPSAHIDWGNGSVRLLTESVSWPRTGRPRRAGVSAFGISGTNVHLILEQPPTEEAPGGDPHPGSTPVSVPEEDTLAWLVSAKTETALREQAARLREHVTASTDLGPADVAYSLAVGRTCFTHRAAVIADTREGFLDGLDALSRGEATPAVITGTADAAGKRTVFVFPGQGTQWPGMAAGLLGASAVFREHMHACAAELDPLTGWSLMDALGEHVPAAMDRPDTVQPILFAVMTSLARLWQHHGVQPGAVIGHSQGEIAAAYIAGALSLTDAAKVVARRSQALPMLDGKGAMASVSLSAAQTGELLGRWEGRLGIGAVNGPRTTVVSGDASALEELLATCRAEGTHAKKLPVSYASHSLHVEAIRGTLLDTLADISPRAADIPFCSAVTGEIIDTAGLDAEYWYQNLRRPVLFTQAIETAVKSGHQLFIEISPHPVLTGGMQDTVDETDGPAAAAIGTLRRDEGGYGRMLAAIASACVCGVAPDWESVFAPYRARRVPLPTYAFQRNRYWLDPRPTPADAAMAGLDAADHPLLSAVTELVDGGLLLTGRLDLNTHPWLADHAVTGVVLLPGAAFAELALYAARQAGCARVDEIVLHLPLVLSPDRAVQVQVQVATADENGRRGLTVRCRPVGARDDSPSWVTHATGTLGTPGDLPPEPRPLPDTWPPPEATSVDLSGVYEHLRAAGLEYGPAFQCLRAVWRHGDDIYAAAALHEDQHGEADRFGIHPALLDAVLQALAVGGHPESGDMAGPLWLPFSWTGITMHAVGATEVRARLTSGPSGTSTLAIADAMGSPVSAVGSLVIRPLNPDQLSRAHGATRGRDSLFTLTWITVNRPARIPEPARPWAVLGKPGWADAVLKAGGLAVSYHKDLAAGSSGADTIILPCPPDADGDGPAAMAHSATRRVLDTVQDLLTVDHLESARLVILTRGAVAAVPGDDVYDLAAASVWGLIRSAESENPGRFMLIDTDGHDNSARAIGAAVATGEPQIAIRDGALLAPRLAHLPEPSGSPEQDRTTIDPEGTVLITGGTGKLGSLLAQHLITVHGARHLLLASRRGLAAPGAEELSRRLADMGGHVAIASCDTADRSALSGLLKSIPPERPLTAVFHTAGVLADATVLSLKSEQLDAVMRPKADAAWNLHTLTADMGITAFVLFSSIAGTLGSAGQGSYAAANTFLDALAHHRQHRGLTATSVAWGLWEEESGMTARLDATMRERIARGNLRPLSTEHALSLLDIVLATGQPAPIPAQLNLAAVPAQAEPTLVPAVLRSLVRPAGPRAARNAAAPSLRDRLANRARPEQEQILLDLVCRYLGVTLGHGSADTIEPDRSFSELGMDSLIAVELRNHLAVTTGLRLPATLAFDYPNAAAIAAHLRTELKIAEADDSATALGEVDRLEKNLLLIPADSASRGRITARLQTLLSKWNDLDPAPGPTATERIQAASAEEIFEFIDNELGRS